MTFLVATHFATAIFLFLFFWATGSASWSARADRDVGAAQALALIPEFSRSGASMDGGLLAGLSNEHAARFSFLLATPIIGAAALLKLPELFGPKVDAVRGLLRVTGTVLSLVFLIS